MAKNLLSRNHRSDLRRLNIALEQIDSLEKLLPLCKSLADVAISPMKDVQEKLEEIIDSSNKMTKLLGTLLAAKLPAQMEVQSRMLVADFDLHRDGECLNLAIKALNRTKAVAVLTLSDLPRQQRHTNATNPQIMVLIDQALLSSSIVDGKLVHQYIPKVSTPQKPYSEIVRICMQAIGRFDPNPEAMIKAHLRRLKRREQSSRARMDGRVKS